MKTAFAVLLSFFCLTGTMRGEFKGFLMGTRDRVVTHCRETGRDLLILIHQDGKTFGRVFDGSLSFKSKEDLDKYFQKRLQDAVTDVITNGFKKDLDRPFTIYAVWSKFDMDLFSSIDYLQDVDKTFSLVKVNGKYQSPDLSGVVLDLPEFIVYKVPDLSWALVETRDAQTGEEIFSEWPGPDIESNLIGLERDIAISGTNGSYRTKIRIVSGISNDFQVFNTMGTEIAPQKPVMKILKGDTLAESKRSIKTASLSAETLAIQITDAEIGLVLQVQSATSVNGPWKDIDGAKHSVWPEGDFMFYDETISRGNFYRIRSVKEVPFIYSY